MVQRNKEELSIKESFSKFRGTIKKGDVDTEVFNVKARNRDGFIYVAFFNIGYLYIYR